MELDLEKIALVRLLIGDTPRSPFYPLYSDEEIQIFLNKNNGNVMAAAKDAAIGGAFIVGGWATRERTGDIEVWNSLGTNYLAALKIFLGNDSVNIPNGLMPWAAGISRAEMCEMARNPDLYRGKLLDIYLCDCERPCEPIYCGC